MVNMVWLGHCYSVRFDKLALIIAASAVVVAAVTGYFSGATTGAVLGVGGLAAAALWQVGITRFTGHASRAVRVRSAKKIYALPSLVSDDMDYLGEVAMGGVAQYLRPEAEVVSFWPRTELGELTDWVISPKRIAIQVISGAGGTGKTRLALRLAGDVSELGWRVQWVWVGTEHGAVAAAEEAAKSTLLIVDYAETRTALPELLEEVAIHESSPELRILLLARSAGEWWQHLMDNSSYQLSEILADVQPIRLGPVSESFRQRDVFNAALRAFADRLGVACP